MKVIRDKEAPVRVVQDTKYNNMYRLQWADGILSADFYNLSRANDFLRHYDRYYREYQVHKTRSENMKRNRAEKQPHSIEVLAS